MHSASSIVRALLALAWVGCATPSPCPPTIPTEAPATSKAAPTRVAVGDIGRVIDAWHAAAARADEDAYFALMSEDAVFLGTDATERWTKQAFRAYAHPHFAKGKAWSFRSVRRAVMVAPDGELAWFDEDLDTPNLGPARGSGVVVLQDGHWLIAHYNLTVTVPNERFDDFKKALGIEPLSQPEEKGDAAE